MSIDQAKLAYKNAPESLKALCDAFTDGLNFYLATHPNVKPALLAQFEPWMPMFFSEGSIDGDIAQISVKGIAAFLRPDSVLCPRAVQRCGILQRRRVEAGCRGLSAG
jgi:hypothetical protein